MDNLVMATPEQSVTERVERIAQPTPSIEPAPPLTFAVKNLSIWYGEKRAIDNVTLDVASNAVTAIIGPSGCGKSTFLRALNRMHELVPKTRMEGTVLIPDPLIPRLFAAGLAWSFKNRIRFRQ